MDNKGKLEIWKRKIAKIDDKAKKLNEQRDTLINLLNEAKARHNTKLNNSLKGMDLAEEISHLGDWIEFHRKEISIY